MAREGQSLFAELAELEGGDEEEEGVEATSQASTPRMGPSSDSRRPSEITLDSLPKPTMVDSGMMTDPWEPSTPVATVAGAAIAGAAVAGATGAAVSAISNGPTTPQRSLDSEIAAEAEETPKLVSSGTQWTPLKPGSGDNDHLANVPTPPKMAWDERAPEHELVEASTQADPAEIGIAAISAQETSPTAPSWPALAISYLPGGFTEPVKHELPAPEIPELSVSSITTQSTEPVQATVPEPEPVVPIEPVRELSELSMSSHFIHSTEPVLARLPEVEPQPEPDVYNPEMAVSTISTQHTAPVKAEPAPAPEPIIIPAPVPEPVIPYLSISLLAPASVEPVEAVPAPAPEPIIIPAPVPEPVLPDLSISLLAAASTEPAKAKPTPAPVIPDLSISLLDPAVTEPVKAELAPAPEPTIIPAPVPEPAIPDLSITLHEPAFTQPIIPRVVEIPPLPVPSISTLHSVETQPVQSVARAMPSMSDFAIQTDPMEEPKAAAAAVAIYEDEPGSPETARDLPSASTNERRRSTGLALSDISGNALLPQSDRQQPSFVSSDQGSQTILSSKQIDQILMDRDSTRPVSSAGSKQTMEMAAFGAAVGAAAVSPFATPKLRPRIQAQPSARSGTSIQRRPDTATSQNSSLSVHPPLPADHREAIAAAEKRSIDIPPAPSPGTMGPPLAPASAYRVNLQAAPRTPNDQSTGPGSARTVSTQARMRRESQSQMSRRSSVSSFASELEERFNMNPYAGPMPNGYGTNTDPRMIQAITQTMIGEFLWKYTRKTGSSDMSSTRHRRYFWVHPYTRTLYWSEQDPQTAGKSQLRTKSVPIESVRVVPDDNPYPPGLHCRSLEVTSPGRKVRFTATTSQRHETWYNALSYLLRRESEEYEDGNSVTLDDIDEFNAGFRSSSRQTARMSLSSYNSRTLRQPPKPQRAASAMSMRSTGGTPGRASPALSTSGPNATLQVPEEPPQRSSSRLSILNNSIRGSIASLKGRHGQAASLHDESIRDQPSVENLAHAHAHGHGHGHGIEDEDRLENVRACCDGKHDVGSLSRNSRYSPRVDRIHSHH